MDCGIHAQYSKEKVVELCEKKGPLFDQMLDAVFKSLYQCNHLENKIKSALNQFFPHRKKTESEVEDCINASAFKFIESLVDCKYDGSSNLEDYFFGFCRNNIRNDSKKKDNNHSDPPDETDRQGSDTPEKIKINKEILEQLQICIDKLSPRCQELMDLWIKQYTHQEIAEELQMSKDNVRKRISECRAKLKNCLKSNPFFDDRD